MQSLQPDKEQGTDETFFSASVNSISSILLGQVAKFDLQAQYTCFQCHHQSLYGVSYLPNTLKNKQNVLIVHLDENPNHKMSSMTCLLLFFDFPRAWPSFPICLCGVHKPVILFICLCIYLCFYCYSLVISQANA